MKWSAIILTAVMIFSSCVKNAGGEISSGDSQKPETEVPDTGHVQEPADSTVMTIVNFETSFLTFHEAGGDLEYSIVSNPVKDAVNASRRCGLVVSGGSQWEFLWSEPYGKNFDFTANPPVFRMKVLSPRKGVKVYMKLKSSDYPSVAPPKEVQNVVTTKEGCWEDLVFDFRSLDPASNRYNKFVLLFDAGGTGKGEEWYFDEIRVPDDDLTEISLFKRWEGNPVLSPVDGPDDWMNTHIANAAVIGPEHSIDGNWWMYARGGNNRNGSNEQIGVFTQKAEEFSPFGPWIPYEGNPVIANGPKGSYDEWRALDSTPVVGKDDVTYLYYKARPSDGSSSTALAYSTDGVNFTKLPQLWKKNSGPTDAVYHQGMYYIFLGDEVYVTDDPLSSENARVYPTITPGGAPSNFDDKIFFGNMTFRLKGVDKWFMAYQGSASHWDFPDRFHVAVSDDLIHWTKVQNDQPFFSRGKAGEWDQCGIWFPEVIEHEDMLYMYYEGWGKDGYIEDRNKPYLDGNSCVGIAIASKDAFLEWCGLK